MPWRLHRATGSSDRTNRILDRPPSPLIDHRGWRMLSHSPLGLLMLKIIYGDEFDLDEAVRHVLVDLLIPYKWRKLLARMI